MYQPPDYSKFMNAIEAISEHAGLREKKVGDSIIMAFGSSSKMIQ